MKLCRFVWAYVPTNSFITTHTCIHMLCEPKTDQFRFNTLSLEMPTPMVYVLRVLEVDWRVYYVYYPCIQMYVGGSLYYVYYLCIQMYVGG